MQEVATLRKKLVAAEAEKGTLTEEVLSNIPLVSLLAWEVCTTNIS